MDSTAIVSSRGQVVIPKIIRDALGLHSGSQLLIHVRPDHILELSPVQNDITLFFSQGAHNITETIDIDQTIAEAISENLNS